jgi:hypothetical protein
MNPCKKPTFAYAIFPKTAELSHQEKIYAKNLKTCALPFALLGSNYTQCILRIPHSVNKRFLKSYVVYFLFISGINCLKGTVQRDLRGVKSGINR